VFLAPHLSWLRKKTAKKARELYAKKCTPPITTKSAAATKAATVCENSICQSV